MSTVVFLQVFSCIVLMWSSHLDNKDLWFSCMNALIDESTASAFSWINGVCQRRISSVFKSHQGGMPPPWDPNGSRSWATPTTNTRGLPRKRTVHGGRALNEEGPGADGCVVSNMPGPAGLSEAVHSSISVASSTSIGRGASSTGAGEIPTQTASAGNTTAQGQVTQ